MILGTAGLTAGLYVDAFLERNNIENKNAIVSGATGGVGSIAVKLLSTLGINVTAITKRGLSCFSQKARSKINNKQKKIFRFIKFTVGKRMLGFCFRCRWRENTVKNTPRNELRWYNNLLWLSR